MRPLLFKNELPPKCSCANMIHLTEAILIKHQFSEARVGSPRSDLKSHKEQMPTHIFPW